MAKAEKAQNKVIVVTNGTSPLGQIVCEKLASAGATVYAFDTDATVLARQAISFRQNKLSLRGVPCDMSSEESISEAIQEVTNHAPPVDVWIHAEVLTSKHSLAVKTALNGFGRHFKMRGKGQLTLLLSATLTTTEIGLLSDIISESELADIVAINLVDIGDQSQSEIASQITSLDDQTPGVHMHSLNPK